MFVDVAIDHLCRFDDDPVGPGVSHDACTGAGLRGHHGPRSQTQSAAATKALINPSGALTTCSGPGNAPALYVIDKRLEAADTRFLHRLGHLKEIAVLF